MHGEECVTLVGDIRDAVDDNHSWWCAHQANCVMLLEAALCARLGPTMSARVTPISTAPSSLHRLPSSHLHLARCMWMLLEASDSPPEATNLETFLSILRATFRGAPPFGTLTARCSDERSLQKSRVLFDDQNDDDDVTSGSNGLMSSLSQILPSKMPLLARMAGRVRRILGASEGCAVHPSHVCVMDDTGSVVSLPVGSSPAAIVLEPRGWAIATPHLFAPSAALDGSHRLGVFVAQVPSITSEWLLDRCGLAIGVHEVRHSGGLVGWVLLFQSDCDALRAFGKGIHGGSSSTSTVPPCGVGDAFGDDDVISMMDVVTDNGDTWGHLNPIRVPGSSAVSPLRGHRGAVQLALVDVCGVTDARKASSSVAIEQLSTASYMKRPWVILVRYNGTTETSPRRCTPIAMPLLLRAVCACDATLSDLARHLSQRTDCDLSAPIARMLHSVAAMIQAWWYAHVRGVLMNDTFGSVAACLMCYYALSKVAVLSQDSATLKTLVSPFSTPQETSMDSETRRCGAVTWFLFCEVADFYGAMGYSDQTCLKRNAAAACSWRLAARSGKAVGGGFRWGHDVVDCRQEGLLAMESCGEPQYFRIVAPHAAGLILFEAPWIRGDVWSVHDRFAALHSEIVQYHQTRAPPSQPPDFAPTASAVPTRCTSPLYRTLQVMHHVMRLRLLPCRRPMCTGMSCNEVDFLCAHCVREAEQFTSDQMHKERCVISSAMALSTTFGCRLFHTSLSLLKRDATGKKAGVK